MKLDVTKCDLTETHVAVYESYASGTLTTACIFSKGLDDDGKEEAFRQLRPYIESVEVVSNYEKLLVWDVADGWAVGVNGRFTPLGCIKVLALLDPA